MRAAHPRKSLVWLSRPRPSKLSHRDYTQTMVSIGSRADLRTWSQLADALATRALHVRTLKPGSCAPRRASIVAPTRHAQPHGPAQMLNITK